jgi:glutamine synthetase
MASSRLEFRPCDPSCNPYLALGGLIAAGLDGIARQQHPGPPVLQNPALLESSGPETAPQRVPQTLQDALTFLQRDAVLCTALGPALVHDYLAVKHAEVAAFADQGVTFDLAQHLYVY